MLVKKGLEQRFRAFFQFLDNLGHRAATAVEFTVSALKGADAFLRKFLRM